MEVYYSRNYEVICHTLGCENAEIVIEVQAAPSSPIVQCGPCGTFIEDVIATSEPYLVNN